LLLAEQLATLDARMPLVCAKCHAAVHAPLDTVLRARDAAIVDRGVSAWPRVWCGGPAEPKASPRVTVDPDIKTTSEANSREHFTQKAKRVQAQRDEVERALTLPAGEGLPWLGPWCVRLTRRSPSELDDDNLARALKAIRDAVAAGLHIDDGSPLVGWAYAQEKGVAGVRIEVWGWEACP
jgi:hypothetical protein